MKKMIILTGSIALILASIVLISYGEMQKTAISKANLSDLKGKWTGSRTIGPADSFNTDLEISNDSLPLDVKLTLYDVRKGGRATTTEIVHFKGKINDQGNFFYQGANNEVELSLYKDDGHMKLEGTYYWFGSKGTMSLKKKR